MIGNEGFDLYVPAGDRTTVGQAKAEAQILYNYVKENEELLLRSALHAWFRHLIDRKIKMAEYYCADDTDPGEFVVPIEWRRETSLVIRDALIQGEEETKAFLGLDKSDGKDPGLMRQWQAEDYYTKHARYLLVLRDRVKREDIDIAWRPF